MPFELSSQFNPRGDQQQAIDQLTRSLEAGNRHQTLLGVTGSGKTFTAANVLAALNKPTLVISHNKTLAAQLYKEFKNFFPHNAVSYFVSYYDYYQPEAYIPQRDIYIEKDALINENIDRLRLAATSALVSREDVIIVASVSCIYGLCSPEAYYGMLLPLERGQRISREDLLRKLVEIQYERNDYDFGRGTFRVRGDIVEIYPSYEENGLRIELFGDDVDELATFDPLTGKTVNELTVTADRQIVTFQGNATGNATIFARDLATGALLPLLEVSTLFPQIVTVANWIVTDPDHPSTTGPGRRSVASIDAMYTEAKKVWLRQVNIILAPTPAGRCGSASCRAGS